MKLNPVLWFFFVGLVLSYFAFLHFEMGERTGDTFWVLGASAVSTVAIWHSLSKDKIEEFSSFQRTQVLISYVAEYESWWVPNIMGLGVNCINVIQINVPAKRMWNTNLNLRISQLTYQCQWESCFQSFGPIVSHKVIKHNKVNTECFFSKIVLT